MAAKSTIVLHLQDLPVSGLRDATAEEFATTKTATLRAGANPAQENHDMPGFP
jgi:hypothetical protein